MALSALLKISERREPGPSPGFSTAHALLAFMTVGSAETIGRQALAKKSGLGEGSIRTIIEKLRKEGLVATNTLGCHLTERGSRTYRSLLEKISLPLQVKDASFAVGASQSAVVVRSSAGAVRNGIEQRDSAIQVGASGATTYVIKSGRFSVPGGPEDCERDFPDRAWALLREELEPRNGDVILVCGAKDDTRAKLGALSAGLTLL